MIIPGIGQPPVGVSAREWAMQYNDRPMGHKTGYVPGGSNSNTPNMVRTPRRSQLSGERGEREIYGRRGYAEENLMERSVDSSSAAERFSSLNRSSPSSSGMDGEYNRYLEQEHQQQHHRENMLAKLNKIETKLAPAARPPSNDLTHGTFSKTNVPWNPKSNVGSKSRSENIDPEALDRTKAIEKRLLASKTFVPKSQQNRIQSNIDREKNFDSNSSNLSSSSKMQFTGKVFVPGAGVAKNNTSKPANSASKLNDKYASAAAAASSTAPGYEYGYEYGYPPSTPYSAHPYPYGHSHPPPSLRERHAMAAYGPSDEYASGYEGHPGAEQAYYSAHYGEYFWGCLFSFAMNS